jgi:hypothetical protein
MRTVRLFLIRLDLERRLALQAVRAGMASFGAQPKTVVFIP